MASVEGAIGGLLFLGAVGGSIGARLQVLRTMPGYTIPDKRLHIFALVGALYTFTQFWFIEGRIPYFAYDVSLVGDVIHFPMLIQLGMTVSLVVEELFWKGDRSSSSAYAVGGAAGAVSMMLTEPMHVFLAGCLGASIAVAYRVIKEYHWHEQTIHLKNPRPDPFKRPVTYWVLSSGLILASGVVVMFQAAGAEQVSAFLATQLGLTVPFGYYVYADGSTRKARS